MSTRSSPPRLPGDSDELTIGGRVVPYETGELPEDFVQRLHLLKKRTGLTWNGFRRPAGRRPQADAQVAAGNGALRRGLSLPGPHRPVGSWGPGPHGRRGLLDLTEGGLNHCLVNVSAMTSRSGNRLKQGPRRYMNAYADLDYELCRPRG